MTQLPLVVLGWVKLLALGFILAECFARLGAGVLPLLAARNFSWLSRFGLGFLLGTGLLGACLLGIACVGLFSPLPILVAALSLLGASWPALGRRSLLARAAKELGGLGPGVLLLLVGAAAARDFLVPVTDQDSHLNHLALPMQYLLSHRVLLSGTSYTLQYPLPVDITHVFALLLGDDRLARFTVLLSFAAVSALFRDWCLERGIRRAAWLGPLLILSSATALELLVKAKNDLPAAGLLIAGALAWTGRRWILGALLLGLAVAAKLIYLPLAAIIVAVGLPGRPAIFPAALLASLPLLPWLARNYLGTGAPLFPFLTEPFETLDWGEKNRRMMDRYWSNAGGGPRIGFLGAAGAGIRENILLFLVAIWAAFGNSLTRRLALAGLAGMAATLAVSAVQRYWLPGLWLLALVGAARIGMLRGRAGAWAAWAAAALSLALAFSLLKPLSGSWKDVLLPRADFLRQKFTTFHEAVEMLGRVKARRVITVGEANTYRLPARVVHAGQIMETPLIWKLAREAGSVERLAIRFRQVGAAHLLHNHVSAAWMGIRYSDFIWEEEPLRNYVDYLKRYTETVWSTWGNNYEYGGYVLYRIMKRPTASPPDRIWFAPGTEQVFSEARMAELRGDNRGLLDQCRQVYGMIPDVGSSWNELGHAYNMLNDSSRAYMYLSEFAAEGMVDQKNLTDLGIAALRLGRLAEAESMLKEGMARSPAQMGPAGKDLVRIMLIYAERALGRNEVGQAMERIGQAEGYLAMLGPAPPWPPSGKPTSQIRELWAVTTVLRGQVSLARGEKSEAKAWFDRAWQICPENPMVIEAQESLRGEDGAP